MHYKRVCNIAILMTSILVFLVWTLISYINFARFNITGLWVYVINFAITFIVAFGFFNLFTIAITKLLYGVTWIKKIMLGTSYIEGTWVGYYLSTSNNINLCYVTIEQSIESPTIINGFSFSVRGAYKNRWNSNGEVSIDLTKNTLSFLYEISLLNDDIPRIGFVNYRIHGKRRFKNPYLITGEAFSPGTSKMHTSFKKYSDKATDTDPKKLISMAREHYNETDFSKHPKGDESTETEHNKF